MTRWARSCLPNDTMKEKHTKQVQTLRYTEQIFQNNFLQAKSNLKINQKSWRLLQSGHGRLSTCRMCDRQHCGLH